MTILGVTPLAGQVLLVIDQEDDILSAEMPINEAERLIRMLTEGVVRARRWRWADTLAQMLGDEE